MSRVSTPRRIHAVQCLTLSLRITAVGGVMELENKLRDLAIEFELEGVGPDNFIHQPKAADC